MVYKSGAVPAASTIFHFILALEAHHSTVIAYGLSAVRGGAA
jgi:hypothetical protein